MTQVSPPTRKEAVLRQLRTEIVNGRLTPGTVLKDAEVAARVGLSITPVREAIAQLAAEGLVDVAPNRARHVTHVTRENALELIDVMAVLNCAGFEWGMGRLTRADLAAMRAHLDHFAELVRRGEDPSAAAAAAAEISRIVITAAGNRELRAHVDHLVARILRVFVLTPESDAWSIWLDGYRETLAHLESGALAAALDRYRRIYTDYRLAVQARDFGPAEA